MVQRVSIALHRHTGLFVELNACDAIKQN